jgi:hypothetical protein
VGQEVEAHAAVFRRQMRGPESLRLDRALNALAQSLGFGPFLVAHLAAPAAPQRTLVGKNLLVDDPRRAQADVVDVIAQAGDR